MSLLSDVLAEAAEWILGGIGPTTARGHLLLLAASGAALSGVNIWLVLTYAHPLTDSEWALSAIIFGILLGSTGAMLSGLHLARDHEDRLIAMATLFVNLGAIVSAILCTV